MKFSIIMPIHNEKEILPYTLPNLYWMCPDEIILIFDRCTDRSEEKAGFIYNRLGTLVEDVKIIEVREKSDWMWNVNYLYDLGVGAATNDIVLLTQADILLDDVKLKFGRTLKTLLKDGGLASLGVYSHPHYTPWQNWCTKFFRSRVGRWLGGEPFSGVLALNKKTYSMIPLGKDSPDLFDTHLYNGAKQLEIPYHFVSTDSFYLRSRLRVLLGFDPIQWKLGVDKYRSGKSFSKVLGYSMLRMLPNVMAGWLQAKLVN